MSRSLPSSEWKGAELVKFRAVVVASALLQLLVLVAISERRSERVVLGLAGGVLLLVAVGTSWSRAALRRDVAMVLTTACVGGLGMLLGMLLDQYVAGSSAPVCPMHAAAQGATMNSSGAWLSGFWMNALMFITCVPACVWLCPACTTRRAGWRLHLACAASMWAGMLVGGRLLFVAPVASLLGPLGAMHLAMLGGMVSGVALVLGLRSVTLPAQLRA